MSVTRGTLTLRRGDGRVVCESVGVADSTFRRMRGLLGRGSLAANEGVVLRPAWSIHTAFMRFPIDVVFIDQDQVVIRIESSLRPFRTASIRGAREIVELAAGECTRRGLKVGDRIAWASRSAAEDGLSSENVLEGFKPTGNVIVASVDNRFVKLARFLLDTRGIGVADEVRPVDLVATVEDGDIDAVLLDGGDDLGNALRLSNSIRAVHPDVPVVIVAERAAARSPEGFAVYDKWDQMDEALDALQSGIAKSS